MERCPTCNQSIGTREIKMYTGLTKALWRVFCWAKAKDIDQFKRKDIKHLLLNENDTARFGDWVLFGGLVYKTGKGKYGLNLSRCEDFFSGKLEIPTLLLKNQLTGKCEPKEYRRLDQIPSLMAFLNEDKEYITNYHNNQTKLF